MTGAAHAQRTAVLGRLAAVGAAVALATGVPGAGAAARQPSFSTRVDNVRVDVEVRRGGQLVAGLTAADFEVFDNGVRQKVEIVAPSAAPVSVVLALDSSASLDARERSHLTRASTRVIDALKPGESATLVTFWIASQSRARSRQTPRSCGRWLPPRRPRATPPSPMRPTSRCSWARRRRAVRL